MHHVDLRLQEVHAVQAHFQAVLWLLRQRRPPGLDPAQKKVRALLLDELEAYAARGTFPKNTHFPDERRPTFIDEDGTRCAVAHLLELSGEGPLALSVRDRMNFAPVTEIVEDSRFVAWLGAAGFTREEVALVQPSYCAERRTECVCFNQPDWYKGASLVTYQRKGWGYEITEVHTATPGVAVGQRLTIPESLREEPEGTEYLGYVFPPYGGDGGPADPVPSSRGSFAFEGGKTACEKSSCAPLRLTKAEALKALLSPSPAACSDYLVSLDDQWDEGGCCGCDMTALDGSSTASLALLGVVVGAIAARRRGR